MGTRDSELFSLAMQFIASLAWAMAALLEGLSSHMYTQSRLMVPSRLGFHRRWRRVDGTASVVPPGNQRRWYAGGAAVRITHRSITTQRCAVLHRGGCMAPQLFRNRARDEAAGAVEGDTAAAGGHRRVERQRRLGSRGIFFKASRGRRAAGRARRPRLGTLKCRLVRLMYHKRGETRGLAA